VEPIRELEETGLRTSKQLYELDILVYATGYDAVSGPLRTIDIRGRGGRSLPEEWGRQAATYLGVAVAGFPNLFVITGPGSPSILYNVARPIEQHVEWISNLLGYISKNHIAVVEPTEEAQASWMELVNTEANKTLYPKCRSWYNGDNVDGKARQFLPFVGFNKYQGHIDRVANEDYAGFVKTPEVVKA
jgi:cyclohexanone monooxygenase